MALFDDEHYEDENWLSDKTSVQDTPWSVLKTFAMKPNYKTSARFVSKIKRDTLILILEFLQCKRERYSQIAH